MAAGHDARADRRGRRRSGRIVEKDPDVERVFQRIFVGIGNLNIVLKKDRKKTSTEFERGADAGAVGDPRRARQFPEPERRRPGGGARDIMLLPRRRQSVNCCIATANKIADEMADLAGAARAARRRRPRPAGNHHQAALRPRRRPWRDHRGAEPDDPHRDARRHRPEQRQILARRPPGADHRVAVGECAARPRNARESPGADLERRLGAVEVGRRNRLRLGPDDHPAHQSDPPHRGRRRPRAGPGQPATPGRRSTSCRRSRTCRRASAS